MKLWVDDIRPAPEGYIWCKSVNETVNKIIGTETEQKTIHVIDIDHDAGDYSCDGGDYIKILDWLEETGRCYPIRLHSANPVGKRNMRAIIQRNGWLEVYG